MQIRFLAVSVGRSDLSNLTRHLLKILKTYDDQVLSVIPSPQVYCLVWLDRILKVGEVARLFCSHHGPEHWAMHGDVSNHCPCRCTVNAEQS